MNRRKRSLPGRGLWLLAGIAAGAAAAMGLCGIPGKRKVRRRLMRAADAEQWPLAVHDCSNHTKFARDLNLRAKEGGWFGQSSYGCEFEHIPYEAFLPVLEDPDFSFVEEEPLPPGFRPGDIVL